MAKTYTLAEIEKRIGYALEDAERKETNAREQLVNMAQSMSEKLVHLAKYVEKEDDAIINSLGELQSRGPELDRLCAEFCMARDHVKAVKFIIGDEGGN